MFQLVTVVYEMCIVVPLGYHTSLAFSIPIFPTCEQGTVDTWYIYIYIVHDNLYVVCQVDVT